MIRVHFIFLAPFVLLQQISFLPFNCGIIQLVDGQSAFSNESRENRACVGLRSHSGLETFILNFRTFLCAREKIALQSSEATECHWSLARRNLPYTTCGMHVSRVAYVLCSASSEHRQSSFQSGSGH
jgi:hypothetical protein